MNTSSPLPLQGLLLFAFFKGYKDEVEGNDNKYFTETSLGHSSCSEERLAHSLLHGGEADYRRRFRRAHNLPVNG